MGGDFSERKLSDAFFWLKFILVFCMQDSANSLQTNYCEELIPNDYKRFDPPSHKGSVPVYIKLFIIDIDEINEESMDFRLHMYIDSAWNDTRLDVNAFSAFNDQCAKYFWIPNVIFERAKPSPSFPTLNVNFKISGDGSFLRTERFSLKVSCLMNFENYPFDVQQCIFSIVFMTNPDSQAVLTWFADKSSPFKDEVNVELLRKIEPLQFYLAKPTTHSVKREFIQGERDGKVEKDSYTYLLVNFTFVRRIVSSIINIYGPSALIVAMSWATFWLRLDAIPARVALSVTSLLTLCTQVQQYKGNLPPVSYVTAMDIWLFVCIFMVFSTLVEFAICYNVFSKSKDKTKKSSSKSDSELEVNEIKRIAWKRHLVGEMEPSAEVKSRDCMKIDSCCKILFPSLFLTFAIAYWVYYLRIYATYNINLEYFGNEVIDDY
ncbi:glycine receptor subunit alpha-2 [Nephila pilipes]|uniref:Glycine receptor subunit alpha-2 n=1 Tax=Nephila pilipes TaxID=299642 RepID=A0A8X6PEQ2_NEPPI|nr:glycine receptor subunit alpha-2 [Nephila pilipes]